MKTRRLILMLGIIFSLMLGTANVANAHSVYVEDVVYPSQTHCTHVRSEISHGTQDSGYSRVDVTSLYRLETPSGGYDCSVQWSRSAYKIRAKYTLMKKINESPEEWGWCTNSEWYYNQSEIGAFMIQEWHGENYTPPCGHGWYGTSGGGYVEVGGQWYGDYVLASQHYLP